MDNPDLNLPSPAGNASKEEWAIWRGRRKRADLIEQFGPAYLKLEEANSLPDAPLLGFDKKLLDSLLRLEAAGMIRVTAPISNKAPEMFIVTGGIHTDTTFTKVVPGTEESYGPFETYEEAVAVWRGRMGWMVDTCEHRLFVVPA